MLPFTDARPCGLRARSLKLDMDSRLTKSLLSLVSVAERGLSCEFNDARQKFQECERQLEQGVVAMTEYPYSLHHWLRRSMELGDGERVESVIEHIPKMELLRPSFRTRTSNMRCGTCPSLGDQIVYDTIKSEFDQAYAVPFDGSTPDSETYTKMDGVLCFVLEKLALVDPDTFDEVMTYVSNIALIDSGFINAGTTFQAFGRLYLACLRDRQDWTAYLEHVVHESAHHHLFAIWSQNSIVTNESTGYFKSPLRAEPRPLSAIYHAMFVLGRTIHTLNLFKETEHCKEIAAMRTQYNNAKNPASFEKKFIDAAEVIDKHAELTAIGKSLFVSTRELVSL